MQKALFGAVAVLGLSLADAAAHDDANNKLVAFKHSGAWEIWCLDIGGSGRVACDLNIVLNYVPQPNFRGMIPRVYLGEDGAPFLLLDYESQTSFGRGYIRVDDKPQFPLADCARPCRIDGERAAALINLLAMGSEATIHFHDHLVESFDVAIDLDGFVDGIRLLREMQGEYRP